MVPFLVPNGELPAFFKELLWLDIKGCSVTIPHKEAIVPLLAAEGGGRRTHRDLQHRRLPGGRPAGRLQHRLSGRDGFARGRPWAGATSEEDSSPLFEKQVLILGAGGVARSIAFGLVAARGQRHDHQPPRRARDPAGRGGRLPGRHLVDAGQHRRPT